jgi:hypothetical protein
MGVGEVEGTGSLDTIIQRTHITRMVDRIPIVTFVLCVDLMG